MSRPHLRVADVLRSHWPEYVRRHPVEPQVRKVMGHLRDCRSAALGGHLHRCDQCGGEIPVYNSCRGKKGVSPVFRGYSLCIPRLTLVHE